MSDDNRIEKIERLQALRLSGTLSEQEFQAEKARLLSGMSGRAMPKPAILFGMVAALAGMIGAVVVWSSSRTADPVPSPSATPSVVATSEAAAEASLSPEEALQAAFVAATDHSGKFSVKTREGVKTTRPLRILDLSFGPVLLTSTEIKDGCHACSGALGVYYLKRNGAGYAVTGKWPDAVPGDGWGAAPADWSLTDKFTISTAILSKGGFMAQGYACSGASITELTPQGPVTSGPIALSYSNSGAVDEETGLDMGGQPLRELNGTITNIVRGKSFDVRVTGAESFVEHYIRRGHTFQIANGETQLSC